MPLVSLVLPVFNCQSTIAACINSLHKMEGEKEIIVIDDGSTDNTARVIEALKDKVDHIFVNGSRKGAAISRNIGNNASTGDYIAVCDVDVYYKNRLKAICEFFEEYEDKSIFYSSLHLRPHNELLEKYLMEAYEWDFESKCPISHPTVAYRKEVVQKVSYKEKTLDSDLYEFFLLDAHKKGFEFGGCQDALMLKVEGNSVRDVEGAKKIKSDLYKEYGIKLPVMPEEKQTTGNAG